jgi:hypothetical protein
VHKRNQSRPRQEGLDNLDAAYADMAADTDREAEALEWIEGLISDDAEPAP